MLTAGQIVKSIAGRDKNGFYMLVEVQEERVAIADGKTRRLDKPKYKNIKHIRPTGTVLDPAGTATDRKLRKALAAYREGDAKEGGY